MKTTCQMPAEAPLSAEPQPAAAPTLVKYAEASTYPGRAENELTEAADTLLLPLGEADRSAPVELAEPFADPLREIVATLLYRYDRRGFFQWASDHNLEVLSATRAPKRFGWPRS